MATLNQRSRVVVFRLTPDEYNSLKSACLEAGARNLSDYTRSELLTRVKNRGAGSAMERKFTEIDRRLADLQDLILRATGRVTSSDPLAAAAHHAGNE